VCLGASDGAAREWALTEHGIAVLGGGHGTRGDHAIVAFLGSPALTRPADPRCPATTSLRLFSAERDDGEIVLPCERWTALRSGFRYSDRSGSAGGVRAAFLGGGRLFVWFGGPHYRSIRGRVPFLEMRLSVNSERYCGRFESSHHRRGFGFTRTRACEELRPRPNFIVINLDDARFDGVDRMPTVQSVLAREGVTFAQSFTPTPVCSPSRASLLTGLHSVNHRTMTVVGAIGGARRFRESGADEETIAVWLGESGYRTGLFGKYLNQYGDPTEGDKGPGGSFYIPTGWDRWWAMVTPEHYGGIHGQPYEIIEEDGTRTLYDDRTTDAQYSTDLSAHELRGFISEAVSDERPFFAYWAPYAPHVEVPDYQPLPADRHWGVFANLPPWRPPNWNETDVSDKPRWVQALPPATPDRVAFTDLLHVRAYETLLSVDEQIKATLDHLAALEVDRDTVIILTSDNGSSHGEHRWFSGRKACAYEECQRVPMIVRYPRRIRSGSTAADVAVLNIDIAPTIAAMAGVEIPVSIDGMSFEASLLGKDDPGRRMDYLMEHWRANRNSGLAFSGEVMDGDQVRLFYGNSGASPRSSALFEFDSGDGVSPGSIPVQIIPMRMQWTVYILGLQVVANVPNVDFFMFPDLLAIVDLSLEHEGVLWWEEVDQGGVLTGDTTMPDYRGVRDVANGYTWVEYESGERELYDLEIDPFQLENVAGDPAYADVRAELEERLEDLVEQAAVNSLEQN
jgi:arylsulfatase A-like enzyme